MISRSVCITGSVHSVAERIARYDEQIIVACGEKPSYGYRRIAWWLQRKEKPCVNRKRVLRVMRERGLLVRPRRLRARRKKEWGRVEAAHQIRSGNPT